MQFKEFLTEDWNLLNEKTKSEFQRYQDNKVSLEDEERSEVMKKKAVWNMNVGKGKTNTIPAVWKSKDKKGKVSYITNTHRAYQVRPSLKGAISIFHKFIKGAA